MSKYKFNANHLIYLLVAFAIVMIFLSNSAQAQSITELQRNIQTTERAYRVADSNYRQAQFALMGAQVAMAACAQPIATVFACTAAITTTAVARENARIRTNQRRWAQQDVRNARDALYMASEGYPSR